MKKAFYLCRRKPILLIMDDIPAENIIHQSDTGIVVFRH